MATVKAANLPLGAAETDPELRSKLVNSLLRIAGVGLMGGAAARFGVGALRNANPRYEPPKPAQPVVVDMPYATDAPIHGSPATDPKKERRVGAKAAAVSAAPIAPVPPIPTVPAPTVSPLGKISPAVPAPSKLPPTPQGTSPAVGPATKAAGQASGHWYVPDALYNAMPNFQQPLGNPGAKEVSDVPAYAGMALPLGIGMGGAGYLLTDKILRAADRHRARKELEEAKQQYQQSTLDRLVHSRLPAKAAADNGTPADPDVARVKAALDRAYAVIKKAQQEPTAGQKLLLSLGAPGLSGLFGPTGAAVNMGIIGAMGGIGGYAGYQMGRDQSTAAKIRDEIKKRDRANAESTPAPVIARLVPVPRQSAS